MKKLTGIQLSLSTLESFKEISLLLDFSFRTELGLVGSDPFSLVGTITGFNGLYLLM